MTDFQSRNLFSNKMAVTTVLFWVSLVLTVIGSNASHGEFTILHSPSSLAFTGSSKAHETILKEIFCASLGLSVEENSGFNGLMITDPFDTPEAVVEVYIDGVSSLSPAAALKGKTYPLVADEFEPATFHAVKYRINQRYAYGNSILVSAKLSDVDELEAASQVLGTLKVPKPQKQTYQYLKFDVDEDYQFLRELEALKTIVKKIKSGAVAPDNNVDFMYFRVSTLHLLSDIHGPNSPQTNEAKKLLGEVLEQLTAALVKAYDGSVLVTVVTTDVAHTRRTLRSARNTRAAEANAERTDGYSADYAAIFNIILWFGVVFTFTLVAIVYALIDMDPGRDSIIYRMTSTRMKKDN